MSTKDNTGTHLAPGLLVAVRRLCDGSPFRSCEKLDVSTAKEETETQLAPGPLLVALRGLCDGLSSRICKRDKTNVSRAKEANETHLAPGLLLVAFRRLRDGLSTGGSANGARGLRHIICAVGWSTAIWF